MGLDLKTLKNVNDSFHLLNNMYSADLLIFSIKKSSETLRLRVLVSPRNETFIRDFLALKICEESKKTIKNWLKLVNMLLYFTSIYG